MESAQIVPTGDPEDITDQNAIGTPGQTGDEEPDFADLLEDYGYETPQRGQVLEGEILEVTENEVIVDVGMKRDAFVPHEDLERLSTETLESLKPGALVMVYVLRPADQEGNLIVSINKALQQADWQRAEDLLESGQVIEATIVGYNKGGLLASFGHIRGFIPQSHVIDIPRGASGDRLRQLKQEMVGRTLRVKVVEVNRQRNRLILSERDARSAVKRARLAELEVGSVVEGEVVGLVDFGAFVDIGGIDGLIHISNIDRRYVNHPSDVLSIGDKVRVRIDDVDIENERISLNRAALMPDPWDSIGERYRVGDLVTGVVTNVANFGIFVALPGHLEGLVHLSEMSTYNVSDPREWVNEGEAVLVRIIDIDPAQQRIALSLNAVTREEQEQWMHERMKQQNSSSQSMSGPPVESMSLGR